MGMAFGLDLGSRRTKVVIIQDGWLLEKAYFGPFALSEKEICNWLATRQEEYPGLPLGATGYGRRIGGDRFKGSTLTEIRAFALGAKLLAPEAMTIVDVGGQDAKVIRLECIGRVRDFEMNDRCAAGTGKFFELVAATLGTSLQDMVNNAFAAKETTPVSQTCAVFAESEIVGRLAEGAKPAELARGVFRAVAGRLAAMLQRVGIEPPVILVGGGANSCLAKELEQEIGIPIGLPTDRSFFGAVGAAEFALNDARGTPT